MSRTRRGRLPTAAPSSSTIRQGGISPKLLVDFRQPLLFPLGRAFAGGTSERGFEILGFEDRAKLLQFGALDHELHQRLRHDVEGRGDIRAVIIDIRRFARDTDEWKNHLATIGGEPPPGVLIDAPVPALGEYSAVVAARVLTHVTLDEGGQTLVEPHGAVVTWRYLVYSLMQVRRGAVLNLAQRQIDGPP